MQPTFHVFIVVLSTEVLIGQKHVELGKPIVLTSTTSELNQLKGMQQMFSYCLRPVDCIRWKHFRLIWDEEQKLTFSKLMSMNSTDLCAAA